MKKKKEKRKEEKRKYALEQKIKMEIKSLLYYKTSNATK